MRAKKVNEDLKNILAPKSMEEIKEKMKNLFTDLFEFGTAKEFIEDTSFIDEQTQQAREDTKKVCEMMGSDPKDVYYVVEEWQDYEKIWSLLRKIETEYYKNLSVSKDIKKFEGSDMTYRINSDIKTAFGHNTDFNGMDVIFFDYPHILELINTWESSPI